MSQDAADRSKRVLAALIREYIASGEPVASSLLVTAAGLGVSSATVRSILSRLEEEGFVQQPHTSAGRIPTDRGYRFYVDLLLESRRTKRAATAVEARLRRDSPDRLLDSLLPQVSLMLSQASKSVGFAIRPAHEAAVFDRVEFVPLGGMRVLVVIVASGGHVIQKVIEVGEVLEADDLRQAANILNAEFSGLPLHRAREAVLQRINEERLLYDALRARAMRLGTSTFSDLPDNRPMYVEGASSLLDDASGLNVQTLQTLLQMIEEKQRLLELLNEYIDGPGLTVVIGAEHLDPTLRPFSLVISTYDDGSGIGTVGVIGPTRMRYSRAIAAVDGAARAVSRVLRDPDRRKADGLTMADEPMTDTPESPEAGATESSELADLQRERDDYKDRWLRKGAEFDNYRKRIERERREQGDQAVVDLLQELLLVVDDFDRALMVDAGEGSGAYRKGIELIHAKLYDLLRKQGVKPIDALGADFDPNLHQAVMHEESPEHREGEVIGELRKGYTMNDRLLRPAMVKVAKA